MASVFSAPVRIAHGKECNERSYSGMLSGWINLFYGVGHQINLDLVRSSACW